MILPEHHVPAVNTAASHENRIHSDEVAEQYGFRGGLVPGVNVYGCLTVPVVRYWGEQWLNRGWIKVRFREPFYESEIVTVAAAVRDKAVIAVTAGRASAEAGLGGDSPAESLQAHPLPAERKVPATADIYGGRILGSFHTGLGETNARITAALQDPLELYREYCHPTVLLGLANDILVQNFVLPAWIHTASEVRNFCAARADESVEVRGIVREAFHKKGHEFLCADIGVYSAGGDLLTRVSHTAIWQPRLVKSAL